MVPEGKPVVVGERGNSKWLEWEHGEITSHAENTEKELEVR